MEYVQIKESTGWWGFSNRIMSGKEQEYGETELQKRASPVFQWLMSSLETLILSELDPAY